MPKSSPYHLGHADYSDDSYNSKKAELDPNFEKDAHLASEGKLILQNGLMDSRRLA